MTQQYTMTVELLSKEEMDEDQLARFESEGGYESLIERVLENHTDSIVDSARIEPI
jgi:hypothetical protein